MNHDSCHITWTGFFGETEKLLATDYSPSHAPCGVIAELQAGEWLFSEQPEGELRWYSRPPSPTLIAKAEEERARRLRTGEAALREAA